MLGNHDAVATVAVKDLNAAQKFYQDTLGLELLAEEGGEVLIFASAESKIFVYRSEFAGTNRATALTWTVGEELEQIVKDLKGKGVKFEHYDLPGMKLKGDLHLAGEMQAAWFKDPDGNILAVVSD